MVNEIYERAGLYRVGYKGWFFWHWVYNVGYDAYGLLPRVFETRSLAEAIEKRNQEQRIDERIRCYRKARWTRV